MFVFNVLLLVFLLSVEGLSEKLKSDASPNIIYMLMDDWGFNDIGYTQNSKSKTPFIDELAQQSSIILNKYYAAPLCSMTRSALMTGRYQYRFGFHSTQLQPFSTFAVSLTETMLPQILKSEFGYSTHMIGKWHLGHFQWEYTPRYRGFDTFAGYYNSEEGYFNHILNATYSAGVWVADRCKLDGMCNGVDLRMNEDHCYDVNETYGTYWKRDKLYSVLDAIQSDEAYTDSPFFVYMAWQASHTPAEAPKEYLDKFADVETSELRRYMLAQNNILDDVFKQVITDLKSRDLWDNTLIIVASDNGGQWQHGDNAPLRGGKESLWEGGVRVPSFVTGGYLSSQQYGKRLDNVRIHVTDWVPTIIDGVLGGNSLADKYAMDGINMWNAISEDATISDNGSDLTDRTLVLNVNGDNCNTTHLIDGINKTMCGALIKGKYKIITGDTNFMVGQHAHFLHYHAGRWNRSFALTPNGDTIGCGAVPWTDDESDTQAANCKYAACLFDLDADPCEYYNIADDNPQLTQQLLVMLHDAYSQQSIHFNDFSIEDDSIYDPMYDFDTEAGIGYWYPFYGYAFDCDTEMQSCQWTNESGFEFDLNDDYQTKHGSSLSIDESVLKRVRFTQTMQRTDELITPMRIAENKAESGVIDWKYGAIVVPFIGVLLFVIWFAKFDRHCCGNNTEKTDYTRMRADNQNEIYYGTI